MEDFYVVNGTKIWTTNAHHADHIFCLVKTNPDVKPQAGISFLLIEMNTPGISVEPIITMAGDHEVNQVFFDNVRVSDIEYCRARKRWLEGSKISFGVRTRREFRRDKTARRHGGA